MNNPKITEYLDGNIKIYDGVFTADELNSIVSEVSSWGYKWGSTDIKGQPPTGMSTPETDREKTHLLDIVNTKTFASMWSFLEDCCTGLDDCVLVRTYSNIFAPRELSNYHLDSPEPGTWTFMLYANNNWSVDEGGETKFIAEGRYGYPEIIAIPPIPGRMILFNSTLPHTATPFRSSHRFTPVIKLRRYDSMWCDYQPGMILRNGVKQ